MQKWFQKILLFLAVATIVGHSSLPHQHHAQIEKVAYHDHHDEEEGTGTHDQDHEENKDEDHSLFSFAQLDENFIPAKFEVAGFELSVLYLFAPEISFQLKLITSSAKALSFYTQYPPPENYFFDLPSRAPPTC